MNKLNEIIADIGNTREMFLLDDFNSRTGREVNNKIVGPYEEDQMNDNGTQAN